MDRITIVKIGGKIINELELLTDFLHQFSKFEGKKILVHGGGRAATDLLTKMGIEPKMIDGRRVTDGETLEVCIGQYAGNINKKIVALLQAIAVDALGLSGADGSIIRATKRPSEPIEYGFAGDIVAVNAEKIMGLLKLGFVPVFCAITADDNGQLLNTNADTIASAVAVSLAKIENVKTDLRFCFEFNGILTDLNSQIVVEEIECDNFEKLIEQGVLQGGVIPKVHNAIVAKGNGVGAIAICGISNLVDLNHATKII